LLSTASTRVILEHMVRQRVAGLPLEQIVGWAEFAGLRIGVQPGVFVPRQRTQLLLRHAVQLAPPRPVVVELCCGSAALSLALATTLEGVELYATDIDRAAVRCAERNLAHLTPPARVLHGDLYEPLPPALAGRVDLLLANAPYVPTESIALMPPEARLYEPRVALDGGADGLDILRRVTAAAPRWLAPGGHLLFETSERQAPHAVAAVTRSGLIPHVASSGRLNATVVAGARPLPRAGQAASPPFASRPGRPAAQSSPSGSDS
jgi:release factor glutamine methyltransferase